MVSIIHCFYLIFILKLDNLKGGGTALSESFMMITHSEDIVKNDEIAKELLLFFSQLQSVGAEFGYSSASEILLLIAKLKLLIYQTQMMFL